MEICSVCEQAIEGESWQDMHLTCAIIQNMPDGLQSKVDKAFDSPEKSRAACQDLAHRFAIFLGHDQHFRETNQPIELPPQVPAWTEPSIPHHVQKEIWYLAEAVDAFLRQGSPIWEQFPLSPISNDHVLQRRILLLALQRVSFVYDQRDSTVVNQTTCIGDCIALLLVHAAKTIGTSFIGSSSDRIWSDLDRYWRETRMVDMMETVFRNATQTEFEYVQNLYDTPAARERPQHDWSGLAKVVEDIWNAIRTDNTPPEERFVVSFALLAACNRDLHARERAKRNPPGAGKKILRNVKDTAGDQAGRDANADHKQGQTAKKGMKAGAAKTSGKKGKEVAAGEVAIEELERRFTEAEANVKAKEQASADKKSLASARSAMTKARKRLEAARIGQSGQKDMEQDADDRQQQGVPDEPIASRPSLRQRLPVSYAEQEGEVQADETTARILPEDNDPEYEEDEDLYAEALPEGNLPHASTSHVAQSPPRRGRSLTGTVSSSLPAQSDSTLSIGRAPPSMLSGTTAQPPSASASISSAHVVPAPFSTPPRPRTPDRQSVASTSGFLVPASPARRTRQAKRPSSVADPLPPLTKRQKVASHECLRVFVPVTSISEEEWKAGESTGRFKRGPAAKYDVFVTSKAEPHPSFITAIRNDERMIDEERLLAWARGEVVDISRSSPQHYADYCGISFDEVRQLSSRKILDGKRVTITQDLATDQTIAKRLEILVQRSGGEWRSYAPDITIVKDTSIQRDTESEVRYSTFKKACYSFTMWAVDNSV